METVELKAHPLIERLAHQRVSDQSPMSRNAGPYDQPRTRSPRPLSSRKLVSPARRRQAVLMLQDRLSISERRACQVVGQHRSTQRHEPVVAGEDQALRSELRRISRRRPRWGYRRAHKLLLDEGWQLNRKRTQRLWREEGLRVPQRRRKRQRLGVSTVPADRRRAQAPDHVGRSTFNGIRPPTG